MDVLDEIDALINRAETAIPQVTRKQKLKLYAEGVKAKLRQADFALAELKNYEDKSDESRSSTVPEEFSIDERVHFYNDSFWTFFFSSFDVLGQVINQALKLGFDEKAVSFKNIVEKLNAKHAGTALQAACKECRKSHPFRNMDNYRNCSTHRRQILIQEQTERVRATAGYSTISSLNVKRTICDNPLALTPKLDQGRSIPGYLEETRTKLFERIGKIVREVQPIG